MSYPNTHFHLVVNVKEKRFKKCSNPAGGRIQLLTVRRFIAQSHSLSPFHLLDMTKIMFKGT